jgi:hypothetical protein
MIVNLQLERSVLLISMRRDSARVLACRTYVGHQIYCFCYDARAQLIATFERNGSREMPMNLPLGRSRRIAEF